MSIPILIGRGIVCGYGKRKILNGIDVELYGGKIVALIGPNGGGKTTLLKALFGAVPIWAGEVECEGARMVCPDPASMLRHGVVYLPQGKRVLGGMTVLENLEILSAALGDLVTPRSQLLEILEMFPDLRPRLHEKAGNLSGGQQQEVALARAFILEPKVMLLDEPSLGLSRQMARRVYERIEWAAKTRGASILIAEQEIREVLRISDRAFVLRNGKVFVQEPSNVVLDDNAKRE